MQFYGFLVSQSQQFKSRDTVHTVHTVHKWTGEGHVDDEVTATAVRLQYWYKSSIVNVDKGNRVVVELLFPQLFFRSPLSLWESCVGLLARKRCAIMQILMRSRRLSCTCAKYPAIGRMGCVFCWPGWEAEAHAAINISLSFQKAVWQNMRCLY